MQMTEGRSSGDARTASGFADYFRTLGGGSRYTHEQFLSFFSPIQPDSLRDRDVIELGFGHGSFLHHVARCRPARLSGVDLGDLVAEVRAKLEHPAGVQLDLRHGDLTSADLGPHDLAYCIGVIHHLEHPERGFDAVLRHTRPGGRFHCWVYAREGNGILLHVVDALRALTSRLSWRFTRWGPALAVAIPLYVYAAVVRRAQQLFGDRFVRRLPLGPYCVSLGSRPFGFFHFLATDFMVARRTTYLDRATLERWLGRPEVDAETVYLIHRNGNSWTFGGRRTKEA